MGDNIDSVITADWNGFGFKFIKKSDYPAVIGHLQQNYYLDEQIHICLGVPITKERVADLDEKLSDIFDLGHGSFYAYPLDQPSMVAAVLIICIHEKGKSLIPVREARSPLTHTIKNAVMQLKVQYDIHNERGVDVYPELFIVSTDKSCRAKGLATEMFRKSIAKLTAQGYAIVSSIFTSPYSRIMGNKLGFKQVSRMNFADVKDEDGSYIFPVATPENFAIGTILDLK